MPTDLTLPGDIPGLLRRGSPVVWDDFSGLRLDLTDATGRMHATWWLAEALGASTVLARTFTWQSVGGHLPGWEIASGGTYLRCYRPGRVDAETGQWMWPFLAELDPTDHRRLADGSWLVDAKALRRVCLHVAGRDDG